jgi:hypothetical protein
MILNLEGLIFWCFLVPRMYLAIAGTHSITGCKYLAISRGFIVGIHRSLNIILMGTYQTN